jgi:hypothetical protein
MEDYAPLFRGSPDVASGRSILRPYLLPPLMDTSNKSAILENARRWLAEMTVVGITEKYAESVTLISDALGLPVPTRIRRLNANPNRADSTYRGRLPAKVVQQLEELTIHDRDLYTYAQDLFEQHWKRYKAMPKRIYSIAPRVRYFIYNPVREAARGPLKRALIRIGPRGRR